MTVRTIDEIFRDFVTDGVPASGPFNPHKPDIRDTLKALLEGLSTFPDNRVIRLNNADEGTANNIVVTASVAIPSAAYQVLFILNVTQENTGPVTVSGAINRALVTNTSAPILSGYLTPGMAVLCIDTGTELRMLSYGDMETLLDDVEQAVVAAQAAQAVAEQARDEAVAAASDAVSQGNVPIYSTRNAVEGLEIPSGISAIRTNGFASVGDGGAAFYVRVASEPSHPAKVQSADGTWWEIASNPVTLAMFGNNIDDFISYTSVIPGIIHGRHTFAASIAPDEWSVISGEGIGKTILERAGGGSGITVSDGASGVKLTGLTVNMNRSEIDGGGHGIRVNGGSDFRGSDFEILDFGPSSSGAGGGTGVVVADTGAGRPQRPRISNGRIVGNLDAPVTIGWIFERTDHGFAHHLSVEDIVGGIGYAHELKNDSRYNNLHALTAKNCKVAVAYGQDSEGVDGAKYNLAVGMVGEKVYTGIVTGEAVGNVFIGGVFNNTGAPSDTISPSGVNFSNESRRNTAIGIASFSEDNPSMKAASIGGQWNYASVAAHQYADATTLARFQAGAVGNVVDILHPGSRNTIWGAVNDQSGNGYSGNVAYCQATGEWLGSLSGHFWWLLDNVAVQFNSGHRYRFQRDGAISLAMGTPATSGLSVGITHATTGEAIAAGFNHILGATAADNVWTMSGWGAGTRYRWTSSGFRPDIDNTLGLGSASMRWSVVYAGTGTINTSDEREKQDIREINEAERRVAIKLKGLIRAFRWREAVAEKGEQARIHFGVIAQQVVSAFTSEELDVHRYALLCYDEWEAEEAVYAPDDTDEDGNIIKGALISPARAAGNRFGVRYDQLLAFIISGL